MVAEYVSKPVALRAEDMLARLLEQNRILDNLQEELRRLAKEMDWMIAHWDKVHGTAARR